MNLAAIRHMRGLSQRALGEMIGKDAAAINRAESMHRSATLLTYQKCADARMRRSIYQNSTVWVAGHIERI